MDSGLDRSRFTVTKLSQYAGRGLLFAPLLFLAIFYFFPLITIFGVSLFPDGQLNLESFVDVATTEYYWRTFWFTTFQAALSTFLTLLFVIPSAYVFTRYKFPGKSLMLSLSTLAFVLPTVVVAVAFRALIGRTGLLNTGLMNLLHLAEPPLQLERTLLLILIVHVFYNYAVALRIITGFWVNQSPRMEEAARILGASGWKVWWYVRLPILRPALLAATILVFIFTFTSFGVVLILGGTQFATLEVEIYRQTANFGNLPIAAALSLIQICIMLAMMIVYTRQQRRTALDLQSAQYVARSPRRGLEKLLVAGNILIMLVLLFTPLLALIISSLRSGDQWTFQFYSGLSVNTRASILFTAPTEAIKNSFLFAIITTLISMVLGVLTAYLLEQRQWRFTRWLDPLFMLPLATSAVTLGFGFIIALDEPPLNLRTSAALIPIAHTLVAMPFVIRSVLPALSGIPPSTREAAAVLGASNRQILRYVDLPLISRGLIVGATFAFTASMGEFGASLFVARPDTPTMPLVIYRLLGQPGAANYGQALAMSVLLMLVCAVSFILIERIRKAGVGEF